MENNTIPIEILKEIENAISAHPNLSRDDAIKIAVRITSEHTQITHNNEYPPSVYIIELHKTVPDILNKIIDEWVKKNALQRDLEKEKIELQKLYLKFEIEKIELQKNMNSRFYNFQNNKLFTTLGALVACLSFLAFPIYIGRPDVAAGAAAIFTAIALILAKFR